MLQSWDRDALKTAFATAKPIPFVKIDNFLVPEAAAEIAASYPPFERALEQGRTFSSVNERRKVQVTNAKLFSAPVSRLNKLLASPEFLSDLSYITGMPNVLADELLLGGGIHMTGPGGRLDVHVDFNYIEDRQLHRRLNLLLYLNSPWDPRWGGQFQLWDKEVKHCIETFDPIFNRCVIFETNETSFHGVVPVSPEAPLPRKSFATYYYTKEAPTHWNGVSHSTVFKARPDEKAKALLLMPAEATRDRIDVGIRKLKDGIKKVIGR
ncbi:2OG-Fe(II) oxygenase [Bradyrhizobium erythrophlei]|uniref:2OG-Fe(II) oxygenase superfamily protein n=1 Tax=Bradyrhizobium erythrophlei TaxID=1437360 RepID=A0A1M5UGZ3_9BRAD|nr:2OG-Fe(II) oxygenase [Bradyrhizobium erythrophlei]SHH62227.1 2OG-Fe(II) oxygenase superfamily protein [Bradyrhizobium erythrophlei]